MVILAIFHLASERPGGVGFRVGGAGLQNVRLCKRASYDDVKKMDFFYSNVKKMDFFYSNVKKSDFFYRTLHSVKEFLR